MVEPSCLADTCTPSSFWPAAEVIEPVSNWSAEAVLTAPTRTTLATLANKWHRKSVMMFSPPHAIAPVAHRALAWRHSRQTPSEATGPRPSARIVRAQRGSQRKHERSSAKCEFRPRRTTSSLNNYDPAILFADLLISVRPRRAHGKGLHGETPILPSCRRKPFDALFAGAAGLSGDP